MSQAIQADLSRDELNSLIDRFEEAWQQGQRPDLAGYVPRGSERALVELVHVELELRLKAGEAVRAEHYLERFPALAASEEAAVALIAAEYKLRRRQEPDLDPEEYPRRFPRHEALLKRHFAELTLPPGADSHSSPAGSSTRYRPVRFHAEGGLGEVLIAHDEELDREVALKRIQAPYADHPESRRRFLLEARITGRLEHPGIVPAYGLTQDDQGRPCYAMRFIQGQTLGEAIKHFHAADRPGRDPGERSLALRQMLTRFVAVCNAVAFAHSRGIVHRDLKPSNVMLGEYGETLVVDWGLAKRLDRAEQAPAAADDHRTPSPDDTSDGTRQGQVIGTPAYMAPEQAAGRTDEVGPASDIYSLGAMLYMLLTGHAPFAGGPGSEILDRVRRGDFLPPRQRNRTVPRPLDAVCLKAMALRPEDRYATALDLAAEVEHWLAHEPVAAHRERWRERVGRWARRHRTWVRAGAAALLVITLMAVAAAALVNREKQRADRNAVLVLEKAAIDHSAAEAQFQQDQALPRTHAARLTQAREALAAAKKLSQETREILKALNIGFRTQQRVKYNDILAGHERLAAAETAVVEGAATLAQLEMEDPQFSVKLSGAKLALARLRLARARQAANLPLLMSDTNPDTLQLDELSTAVEVAEMEQTQSRKQVGQQTARKARHLAVINCLQDVLAGVEALHLSMTEQLRGGFRRDLTATHVKRVNATAEKFKAMVRTEERKLAALKLSLVLENVRQAATNLALARARLAAARRDFNCPDTKSPEGSKPSHRPGKLTGEEQAWVRELKALPDLKGNEELQDQLHDYFTRDLQGRYARWRFYTAHLLRPLPAFTPPPEKLDAEDRIMLEALRRKLGFQGDPEGDTQLARHFQGLNKAERLAFINGNGMKAPSPTTDSQLSPADRKMLEELRHDPQFGGDPAKVGQLEEYFKELTPTERKRLYEERTKQIQGPPKVPENKRVPPAASPRSQALTPEDRKMLDTFKGTPSFKGNPDALKELEEYFKRLTPAERISVYAWFTAPRRPTGMGKLTAEDQKMLDILKKDPEIKGDAAKVRQLEEYYKSLTPAERKKLYEERTKKDKR